MDIASTSSAPFTPFQSSTVGGEEDQSHGPATSVHSRKGKALAAVFHRTLHIAILGSTLADRVHLVQLWIGLDKPLQLNGAGYLEAYYLHGNTKFHFVVYSDQGCSPNDNLVGKFSGIVLCTNTMLPQDYDRSLSQAIFEADRLLEGPVFLALAGVHPPDHHCLSCECEQLRTLSIEDAMCYAEALGNILYVDSFHEPVKRGYPQLDQNIVTLFEADLAIIEEDLVTIKQFLNHCSTPHIGRFMPQYRPEDMPGSENNAFFARLAQSGGSLPYSVDRRPPLVGKLPFSAQKLSSSVERLSSSVGKSVKEFVTSVTQQDILYVGVTGDESQIGQVLLHLTGSTTKHYGEYWALENSFDNCTVMYFVFSSKSFPPDFAVNRIGLWLICYATKSPRKDLYERMRNYVEFCYGRKGLAVPEHGVSDRQSARDSSHAGRAKIARSSLDDEAVNKKLACFLVASTFDPSNLRTITETEGEALAKAMNAMFYIDLTYKTNLIQSDRRHRQAYLNVLSNPQSCFPPIGELPPEPDWFVDGYRAPKADEKQLINSQSFLDFLNAETDLPTFSVASSSLRLAKWVQSFAMQMVSKPKK